MKDKSQITELNLSIQNKNIEGYKKKIIIFNL